MDDRLTSTGTLISVGEVRDFLEEDYPQVASWYKKRGWPELPIHMLPQTGAILEGKAAGFLYRTDSPIGWLEWVVSNPDVEHSGAIEAVLNYLTGKAKELGVEVILCSLSHSSLIEKYKKAGFFVTDGGMTNMMRRV